MNMNPTPTIKQPTLCAVPQCGKVIAEQFLMCRGHWSFVPLELRNEVHRTWRIFRRSRTSVAAIRQYRDARKAAVDAIIARGL